MKLPRSAFSENRVIFSNPWLRGLVGFLGNLLCPGLGYWALGAWKRALGLIGMLGILLWLLWKVEAPRFAWVSLSTLGVGSYYLFSLVDVLRLARKSASSLAWVYTGMLAMAWWLWPSEALDVREWGNFTLQEEAMTPTLRKGELVAYFEPLRRPWQVGDVVVLGLPASAEETEDLAEAKLRRLVGLPGDTLEIRAEIIYRNGQALDWSEFSFAPLLPPVCPDLAPQTLPTGVIFAVSDQRRFAQASCAEFLFPLSMLRGRALFVDFSADLERLGQDLTRPPAP